ncbi:putative endonuclease [Devosia enhydra]|uniref:Putative endonuclease n=1 Tax=Devosia enhydra TaxID=665118 RepID=A0A1K2I125_9HYPH|nr:GIY-YIG nuclease family protein [Devosia enhydra]SFZ85891.1 putative endonuclease [Devosia enhydra]
MDIVVYILRCADGSYYVGNTRKPIEQRVAEHNGGLIAGYTQSRPPVELAYSEVTNVLIVAFERERQLKGWSRAKKEALIAGQSEDLPRLASRRKR